MDILDDIVKNNVAIRLDSNNFLRNCIQIKKNMSLAERKLLLQIINEKDLLVKDAAYKNYKSGFSDGVSFASEIFLKYK